MKRMFLIGFLLLFCLLSLFGEEEKPAVQEEKKIAVPVILNLIPGLGIGSFTQGDTLGGVICLVGDLAGGGLIAFGVCGSSGTVYLTTEDCGRNGLTSFLVSTIRSISGKLVRYWQSGYPSGCTDRGKFSPLSCSIGLGLPRVGASLPPQPEKPWGTPGTFGHPCLCSGS